MMITNTSNDHMEDRLSNLPDVILTQILSFLRTKEAVRTGILSTRWKSVWACVPTLNLCKYDFKFKGESYDDLKVTARFLTFMDRVLMAGKVPSFEKISVSGSDLDPYPIISWIRAAVERNVHELDVNISQCFVDPPCELTQDLFSCNKLVVLKLSLDMVLYFPTTGSSCFPNLKVLKLDNILYDDDDSAPNLFSCCPILEDLVIVRPEWDNLGTLNVTSCSLKRLEVKSYSEEGQLVVQKMVIDASAVESLDVSCLVTQEYVVKDLSSIVEAKLNLSNSCSSFSMYGDHGICLFELLGRISNVKFLTLTSLTVESLASADSCNLPIFHNLTRLEIVDDADINSFDLYDDWNWELMIEILKSSPVLEILIFKGFFSFSMYEERRKASEWDVPNCLVSHLKTVEILNYHSEDDVEKVRYFLINAQVLEKMTIRYFFQENENLKLGICDEIFKKARGSVTWSDSEIIISFPWLLAWFKFQKRNGHILPRLHESFFFGPKLEISIGRNPTGIKFTVPML